MPKDRIFIHSSDDKKDRPFNRISIGHWTLKKQKSARRGFRLKTASLQSPLIAEGEEEQVAGMFPIPAAQ